MAVIDRIPVRITTNQLSSREVSGFRIESDSGNNMHESHRSELELEARVLRDAAVSRNKPKFEESSSKENTLVNNFVTFNGKGAEKVIQAH